MLLILGFFAAPQARQNLPLSAHRGRTATQARFQEDRFEIEKLRNSRTGPENRKTQRTERSQEITENKGHHFLKTSQSQEASENKMVIFVKPRGY
jgi:hypothetical protein